MRLGWSSFGLQALACKPDTTQAPDDGDSSTRNMLCL